MRRTPPSTHSPAGFLRDTKGATFVEYIILVGVVALLAQAGFRSFGTSLRVAILGEAREVALLEGGGNGNGNSCLGGLCTNGKCFAAGTLVATEQGQRAIESIRVGDRVLSRDPVAGSLRFEPVVRTFVSQDAPLVEVREGSESIRATPGHRFWVIGRGWVEAAKLAPGDTLLSGSASVDSEASRVERVVALAEHATVYNLEVEESHSYFVGRAEALVHNGDCTSSGGGQGDPTSSGAAPSGGASSGGASSGGVSSGGAASGGPSSGSSSSGPVALAAYVNNNPRATPDEKRIGEQLDTLAQNGELPGVARVEGAAETPGARSGDYRFIDSSGKSTPADLYQPESGNPRSIASHVIDKSGQANVVVVDLGAGQSGKISAAEATQMAHDVVDTPGHSVNRVIVVKDGGVVADVSR